MNFTNGIYNASIRPSIRNSCYVVKVETVEGTHIARKCFKAFKDCKHFIKMRYSNMRRVA